MPYSKMRTFDNDGINGKLILTANKMGFMSTNPPDEYVQAVIDFSRSADGPVADLGCAYGYNARLMLEAGAEAVIANDVYEDHLTIFDRSLTPEQRTRTTLVPGDAMQVCADMEPASVAGILAANWLHFLTGENVRKTFGLFYRALKPGGVLVVTVISTKMGLFRSAADVMEKKAVDGHEWPGLLHSSQVPLMSADLPDFCLYMDPPQLIREAKLAGFEVIKSAHFALEHYPDACKLDGRESSGIIAKKPLN